MDVVGWVALSLGFASALAILALELRRELSVMSLVHPVTALYLGPAWVWVYLRRREARVAHSVSHCGAGCTLGDVAGEWTLWALGATAFGWELGLDFLLAWTFGIFFQRAMVDSFREAIKVDTLSIVAFQAGLFAWMAIGHYAFHRPIDSSGHWFLMQVGMILGFGTAWPVNAWLLRRGWKEPMA